MSFHHLDQYARVESPLTRRSPTVRLVGTVLIAVGAALLPLGAWPQMVALGSLVGALAAAARIPARGFLLRLAPPLGFVLMVSVAILFLAPGAVVARLGPLAVTDAGLLRFGSAAGRAAVALGAAVILVSTTPFTELIEALRALRLPTAVTTALGLAYRYLYILNDEVERLRRAARSRNAAAGSASRRRLLVGISGAALRRSFDRSERIHRAMLGRGFTGRMPALRPRTAAGHPALEVAALAAVVAAIAVSALL
ncbi:MAG: cobalt ECF transporter T component CbiQ [Gemmatimonadetes bacterium]|nr:cobalt ECF transporter T component CbiQ [Gemmatimonadota bacterium]NIQ56512.1 cobalt ECF transporter T component CbiQ [Gemmatimonadota bacterium]NIU76712.1 cobalt ECF transporter T component CbiQ [Gammaproteobacteria bacterium]NIX46122.1 cobalt ECF transporter T component CbiQ [Gemmatimonadota bacterium]NIY10440.1 cobalt ECF transporter T component CbiQ [Gemmatimonadota bacterium]